MSELKDFKEIAKQISEAIEKKISQDCPDDLAEHIKELAALTASAAALQKTNRKASQRMQGFS